MQKQLTPLNLSGGPYHDVEIFVSIYVDDMTPAITISDRFTGETIAVASVNVGGDLDGNEVHIKDYSENEGVFDWLVSNHLIAPAPSLDKFNGFITARGGVILDQTMIEQLQAARREYFEEYKPWQ